MGWYKEFWDKLPKWLRWLINRIDDPFDNFKHWWHGLEICWYSQWYKCEAYMKNKPGTKWRIYKIDKPNPNANNHIWIGKGCEKGKF
jgi:hypothetical protein